MLAEFSLFPLGGAPHISDELAEALTIVDRSGLPYQLTPTGTCLEGEWGEVMRVIRLCEQRMRQISPHVVTLIKIEDDQDAGPKLIRNVTSVEEKLGRPLSHAVSASAMPETEPSRDIE